MFEVATVVVGAPGTPEVVGAGTVVTEVSTTEVPVAALVDVAAAVVVVLVLLGNRDGPPAAVVVGALLPLTAVVGVVDVLPTTAPLVEVVAPGLVVVVLLEGFCFVGSEVTQGSPNWSSFNTGRRYTWPVTLTSSSACCWFFTPGRLTMIASPCRRISGSATPRLSTRARMRSTARSRLDELKAPTGCWVMEMPPCRSRPNAGLLPAATVAIKPPNARTRIPTSE